jgi:hypothetical protein
MKKTKLWLIMNLQKIKKYNATTLKVKFSVKDNLFQAFVATIVDI